MGDTNNTIRLYAMQAPAVIEAIDRDGVCFCKRRFVESKYGLVAPGFLAAYTWFAREAAGIVPPPPGAELPYWVFGDMYRLDGSGGGTVLFLDVPVSEAVFFDMYDWNRVLQLRYLPKDEKDGRDFRRELEERGLTETKVMTTPFYPELKARIEDSWRSLFRHDAAIRSGDRSGVGSLQAALWCIKREWITERH